MIVGLTGGICSGKTEAARELVNMGVRVLDADEIARFLTTYEPRILAAIEERFGEKVFTRYGALDRQRLARIVFQDEQARQTLESILHPPILALQHQNIAVARAAHRHLVICAPLLIETGAFREVDRVVLVSCTLEQQLLRLQQRDGLSSQDAYARISAQLPLADKQKFAQVVIDNNDSLPAFREKVHAAFVNLFEQEPHA